MRTVSEGSSKWEYDPAGRIISCRWLVNPSSESSAAVETWTYDGSNRLLSDTVRSCDGSLKERTCFYDDRGRILKIVEKNGDLRRFEYDKQGCKTETREIAHASYKQNRTAATGIDVIFDDIGEPCAWFRRNWKREQDEDCL